MYKYIYIYYIYIHLLNVNHKNSYDKSRFIWYSSLDEEFLGCRKKGVRGHWTYLQVPLAIWAWWSGNWGCHMKYYEIT